MSGDIIHCSKSSGILRLDEELRRPTEAHRQVLQNPDVFAIMRDAGIVTPDFEHHMRQHILGDAWWPDAPSNKADILRAAYLEAVDRALKPMPADPPKPIVTYHIKGLPKEIFEVIVSETDREVHVMWLTPATPVIPVATPLEEQRIWVVGDAGRVGAIRQHYIDVGFPAPPPIEDTGVPAVKVMNCPTY